MGVLLMILKTVVTERKLFKLNWEDKLKSWRPILGCFEMKKIEQISQRQVDLRLFDQHLKKILSKKTLFLYLKIDFDSFQMSHSKSKRKSTLKTYNNSTNLHAKGTKPSVHIFPNNQYPQLITELILKLQSLHIVSAIYQNYKELQTVVLKVDQYTNKQIFLVQLQSEKLGADCCFPQDYAFPTQTNILIVFFSFKPITTRKPHLLSMDEIISFCWKELKPYKIKLKSIQNLKSDSRSKNDSAHSKQKQKLTTHSYSLISQFNSQIYELLFYLDSGQVRLNLNQNQFNYHMLLRSIKKLQKCQPFTSLQDLLKKEVHKQQKKYIIFFNISSEFLKIVNEIKKEELSCFDIILFGDMKPINLYMEKLIVLATSDSNLIFKFLKNHGFDSPELRQQNVRKSLTYSISSNDFRNQMDNIMNIASQYSSNNNSFLKSFAQQRQAKKKTVRHWLVDKDSSQPTKFITTLVKVQQTSNPGSVFSKVRSLSKSPLSSSRNKIIRRSYLSPRKSQSILKIQQAQEEFQTKELQLQSHIKASSQITQKKSQIKQQSITKQQEVLPKPQKQIKADKAEPLSSNVLTISNFQQKIKQNRQKKSKLSIKKYEVESSSWNSQKLVSDKQQTFQDSKQAANVLNASEQSKKQKNNNENILVDQTQGQSNKIKRESHTVIEKLPESQYYLTVSNKQKNLYNQNKLTTPLKHQLRLNRLLSRNNSGKVLPNSNSVSNRQNIIRVVQKKSVQQKPASPDFKFKNRFNKNVETKESQREQLVPKKVRPIRQSLDEIKNTNISSLSKSKFKYNFYAEKTKINVCICGEDFIEKAFKKISYLNIEACRFHFIIEDGLNYINRAIQKHIAFANDKIRTYKKTHELYQFLRVEEQYDLGFIFCLNRNSTLINPKLVPQHYYMVNIQNLKESFLELNEENRRINIGDIKYFKVTQSILIQQKLQKCILYRKKNKNVSELIDKFKNSEFLIQPVLTNFSKRLIDSYFYDNNRLTRLYFVCDEAQLLKVQEIIEEYQSQNRFFQPQCCIIICVLQKQPAKNQQKSQNSCITYVGKGGSIQEYNDLLDLIGKKNQKELNTIDQQVLLLPHTLAVDELFNEQYPGRFELISYKDLQQAELVAASKKSLGKECQIYLLALQNSITNSQIFDKKFMLTSTKKKDSTYKTVSNVQELLQLLRF